MPSVWGDKRASLAISTYMKGYHRNGKSLYDPWIDMRYMRKKGSEDDTKFFVEKMKLPLFDVKTEEKEI